jgi:hypothetical protein
MATENQRIACQNIVRVGGIAPVSKLLACRTDRIMYNAITTFHSILCCLESVNNNDLHIKEIRAQFHQRSTRSFYARKLQAQVFCA